jgi:hypothetical protein
MMTLALNEVIIHPTPLSLSLRGDLKIDAAISGGPD